MTNRAHIDLPTGVQSEAETVTLESGITAQVCRTSVRHDDGSSIEITLLLDMQGLVLPTEADLLRLRVASPSVGILAGLQLGGSGKAEAITLPEFYAAGEYVALASAVCAASWGWDESESIHVIVNRRAWKVTPAFRDGMWTATAA